MDMLLEKIYKVVTDFEKLRFTDSKDISHYKVNTQYLEGSFDSYKDVTDWSDYKTGDFWGNKGQYSWFKTSITIPEGFQNKKVMFSISTGHKEGWDISNPQFLLYVNDELRQGLDVNHKNTLLSDNAISGLTYDIIMLGYSGLEESPVILKSSMKVVDPLLEDFYYNLSNLFWALSLMELQDSRRPEFVRNLIEAVDELDLRSTYSKDFYQSVEKANHFLVERYYTTIQNEGPVVTSIGHTHIDIAWMWTIEQTKEKAIRSFSTVLELMELYPEYKFMSSQPQLYAFVKEYNPKLYEKIKAKIAEGRWEVDGGMWLEADCNIPSGESLSRQFLYGTRFIKEEFNKTCSTLWLPDVFGYSAALPQLIKKSGMSYMMTSKLDWNRFNKMPHDSFMWKGIDGSEVLTHLITTTNDVGYHEDIYQKKNENPQTTYNGRLNPNQVKGTWTRYQDKLLTDETLQLFGFGDGGGGPTEEMLENYKRLKYGLPGLPKVDMDFQQNYFNRLQKKAEGNQYIKKWQGELYLEFHQGTYTSMAENKRANRKAEFLYQSIECISTIAQLYSTEFEYPDEVLHNNWKRILLYQFHDIIPGTSISEVYEETKDGYNKLLNEGNLLLKSGLKSLENSLNLPDGTCMIFNPLSHKRTDLVLLSEGESKNLLKVVDMEGNDCPMYYSKFQKAYTFLATNVPGKGIKLYKTIKSEQTSIISTDDSQKSSIDILLKDNQAINKIENIYYNIQFNKNMEIISLFDKQNNREIIKEGGRGNILQIFDDRPRSFDNWNIDITYKDKIYEMNQVISAKIVESNPLYQVLEIKRAYNASTLNQRIVLYHFQARIDFKTEVDWHEEHILLKVAFEVDLNAINATYDIQYGNITRATHENTSWEEAQYEVCGHKWADVSESGYGVSLMNDCKYGYDIKDNCMRLTLIKCGTYPNENADQGQHTFTYSIYGHNQTWLEADTIELAYNLNVPLEAFIVDKKEVLELQNQKSNVTKSNVNSSLAKNTALFSIDGLSFIQCKQKNIIIDTIKLSEDKDGTIIRLFENKNIRNISEFKTLFKIKSLYLCDLVENKVEKLPHEEFGFNLKIKGFEVITLHLEFEKDVVNEN